MLRRLRRRFILISMGLVAIVLVAVLGASVASGYQTQRESIQEALSEAVAFGNGDSRHLWIGSLSSTNDASASISIGGGSDIPVFVVTRYELSGLLLTRDNIASMDEELFVAALARIKHDIPTSGDVVVTSSGQFSDLGLYYLAATYLTPSGPETRVAFANATPLLKATMQQAGMSALIFIGAMLVLLGITSLLSRIALRPVEQAWEKQRRFVADASHELKTPLTVILANTNLLRAHPEATVADQMQWVESTQCEALRMDGLVRDLLLLAQTEEGAPSAHHGGSQAFETRVQADKPVDLSEACNRSLLQFDAVFFERGVSTHNAIADNIYVLGDAEHIDRLIGLLLDNASKYCNADGTVSVSLTSDAEHAKLAVTNSGEPIDPERLAFVFDRFYRCDDARSEQVEGYGLGLSLAKSIVEAHRGSIAATSNRSDGTTFTVILPRRP
ncbi:MAG: HAMP domain-containing histidine kinase [Coriobacteriales bacterium]|jgi:signal transduction histidine kinase|nr:HAMP domain-containing histidine kinase [Coriobacteriales bacterium]